MIRLYDTLTGDVRPLAQRDEGKVSLYACGPTVYDHPHLGHARQAMTYDFMRRYFEWRGLEVHHAANVTDIDDNIINRAKREGSTESAVAAEWKAVYDEAIFERLNILRPHDRPHATEFVAQMVEFIETLVDNGTAYANESGVYLRVHLVEGYGDLVHRSLEELREGAGARVDVDDNKEDPLDFALWKAAKPGEPVWPSPWGDGRPGWHIECVAMSLGISPSPTTPMSGPRRSQQVATSLDTGPTTRCSTSAVRRCRSPSATTPRSARCSTSTPTTVERSDWPSCKRTTAR